MSGKKQRVYEKSSYTNEDSLNITLDLGFTTYENSLKTDGKGDCIKGVSKTDSKSAKLDTPQGGTTLCKWNYDYGL